MAIVNDWHKHMLFSAQEWEWIAKRHGLKLKDTNWERRKYGRYGKPGEKKASVGVPMPAGIDEMAVDEPMPVIPVSAVIAAEMPAESISPMGDEIIVQPLSAMVPTEDK